MTDSPRVPRATFTTQWTRKTAMDGSLLYPIIVDEILPGDHISYEATAFLRMATPYFPQLSDASLQTFFFFVPARLVWDKWRRFMGEQTNPGDSIAFTVPKVLLSTNGDQVGSLPDHMGLPVAGQVAATKQLSVNALPFRAYMLVCHEWFRDENMQASYLPPMGDGPDAISQYSTADSVMGLYVVNKTHDYFTSSLPWPQKFVAPTVPLAGQAPIKGLGFAQGIGTSLNSGAVRQVDLSTIAAPGYGVYYPVTTLWVEGAGGAYADLSTSTGVAINTLRTAFQLQTLLERDARGGTRYTELLKMHFDVTSPDARLQRPEYLGGGRSSLQVTAVAQTAPTAGVPLGTIGGAGTIVGHHGCSVAAVEHGYLLGLAVIRAELAYSQGYRRMWSRSTRYDFAWPELVELGEQTVFKHEIYADGSGAEMDAWGFVPRYEEYRTLTSEAVGIMRPRASGTLAAWHLAENFASSPTLGSTFLREPARTVLQRVQTAGASALGQQFIGEWLFSRRATRPITALGTPSRLGRF